MKRYLRYFYLLGILCLAGTIGAQDCNNDPPPSQCICQVTPICGLEDLDQYCLEMDNFATPFSGFPGCGGNVLNNPNWFAFVAGTNSVTLSIQPSDCQGIGGGGGIGIQAAIYSGQPNDGEDCSTCQPISQGLTTLASQCGCTTSNINFTSIPTQPGVTYYIVIDGCGGDVCNVNVDVIEGGDPPAVDDPTDLQWPSEGFIADTVCLGATDVPFSVDAVFGASSYVWTLPSGRVEETVDPVIYVDYPNPGTYTICVYAQNDCDQSTEICEDVVVAPLDPVVDPPVILCEGESLSWEGQTIDQPGTYTATRYTSVGCAYEASIEVDVINENDENPTIVTETRCLEEGAFDYHGYVYGAPGVTEDEVTIMTPEGCDSFVNLTVIIMSGFVTLGDPMCTNGDFIVCPTSQTFMPDPGLYPEFEIVWEWRQLSTGTIISSGTGEDYECLNVGIDDFTLETESFQLTIYMTYNGEPQPACLVQPDVVEISLADYLPNVDTIMGPDTLCANNSGVYEAVQGIGEDIIVYNWDLSGFPGASFVSGAGSSMPEINFSQGGQGEICLIPESICGPGEEFCYEVRVFPPPEPMAGNDTTLCGTEYDLQASASTDGFWSVSGGPSGNSVTFSDETDPLTSVSVDPAGAYTFVWNEGFGDCLASDTVNVNFASDPMLESDTIICDGAGENYTLEIVITGGTPPYTVTSGNGTITGNVFTSDIVPSGSSIDVSIVDANGCGPLNVSRSKTCDCNTETGEMDLTQIEACETECVQGVYNGGDNPDANDITEFILHDNAGAELGTIIDRNSSGEFCFDGSGMNAGDTYYISFVVGNDAGGGMVDVDDPCLAVSQGQPVVWSAQPTADAGSGEALCGTTTNLSAALSTGTGQWTQLSGPGVASFDDATDPASSVSVDLCGAYEFQWVEINGPCSDTATVQVEFNCDPELLGGSLSKSCNATQTAYDVTFEITNGTPPYTLVSGPGSINGTTFTATDLVPEIPDTIVITDANDCGPLVVTVNQSCNCETDAGTMDVTMISDCESSCLTATANPDDTLDGDDAASYVLHNSANQSLGTVYATSLTPEFCWDDVSSEISCGQTYYISRIVGNNDGSGFADISDGCLSVAAGTPVMWHCNPVADAGADEAVCGLQYTLSANPSVGEGSWGSSGSGNPVFDVVTSSSTGVTVDAFGTHCFTWTEDNNGCTDVDEVCITFESAPTIDPASVSYDCNATYDSFTVSFTIMGGDEGSYQVDGLPGVLTANSFTSEYVASGSTFSVEVYDANDCIRDTLTDTHDCGCFTDAATMDQSPLDPCEGETVNVADRYDPSAAMLDGNDEIIYILHDNSGPAIGNIFQENTGTSFSFDAGAGMDLEVTYYISAVAGNGAAGSVDLSDGCLSVTSGVPVTWHQLPTLSISASDTEVTCQQPSVTLSVMSALPMGDYNFLWTSSDGNIEPGDETLPDAQVNSAGTYVVTMTHALYGCESTDMITITQSDDVPTASIAPPESITCARTSVQLDGSASSSGAEFEYAWSGPGIVGDSSSAVITAEEPGLYILEVSNTSNGCDQQANVTVEEDIEEPLAVASAAEELDCDTDQVTVSGEGSEIGDNISYQWMAISPDANVVSGASEINAIVNAGGDYELTVINNVNGCESTATTTVQENDNVISDVVLDVQQPGCVGDNNGSITVAEVDGGTPPYTFSFDGGSTFGSSDQINFLGPGEYEIVVVDDAGCSFTTSATLEEAPPISVDLGESILVELGEEVELMANASIADSAISQVIWQPLADTANANELIQVFTPPAGQSGYSVTIIDANGCSATDNIVVLARVSRDVYIPNVLRPESEIPINRYVGIYADPEKVAVINNFQIFDRWGNKVFERSNFTPALDLVRELSWDGTFDGEELTPGVFSYYAEVVFSDNFTQIYKGEITLVR